MFTTEFVFHVVRLDHILRSDTRSTARPVQHTIMSYPYGVASESDRFSDTTARAGRIVLPPFSTVSTQAASMRCDDVGTSAAGPDIGGQPFAQGSGVQVMWTTRLSLCSRACVFVWFVLALTFLRPARLTGE